MAKTPLFQLDDNRMLHPSPLDEDQGFYTTQNQTPLHPPSRQTQYLSKDTNHGQDPMNSW